jgi:hypothetical protein
MTGFKKVKYQLRQQRSILAHGAHPKGQAVGMSRREALSCGSSAQGIHRYSAIQSSPLPCQFALKYKSRVILNPMALEKL